MRPALKSALPVVAVVVSLALVAVAVVLFLAPRGDDAMPDARETPLPSWAPPAAAPSVAPTPTGTGIAGLADPGWLDATAAATGIPRRALAAYAGAAIVKAETMPECALSWATLAGVGATESDHGRHGAQIERLPHRAADPLGFTRAAQLRPHGQQRLEHPHQRDIDTDEDGGPHRQGGQ